MANSALMTLGVRSMLASTAGLNTTGHNIANASVEGYSRQSVKLETTEGQFTGAGFFGKGVTVANVVRAHDEFLTRQFSAARSQEAMDQARTAQLVQLQDIFPPGEQGVGYAMGDFLNAMVDLANTPADSSARQVVMARAADVADRYAAASDRLDVLQAGVRADVATSAGTVNGLARQVAQINDRIAGMQGLGAEPNDLLDQRDQLILEIGKFVQVSTVAADDGSVGLFVGGGQSLVLGSQSSDLVMRPDADDPTRAALTLVTAGGEVPLEADMLSGGSLAGLMRFQNEDLVDARNQLGQIALAFASRVNEAQSCGLDLRDPAQAGDDLFATGPMVALPNTHNARDASGALLATVTLEVTDASLLQASDYRLEPDGSGNAGAYTITRLSDGRRMPVSDGGEVDGFRISVGSPDLAAGDRFLLQPVGRAASGMHRAFDDTDGLAAASPVTATLGEDNRGTASVSALTVTSEDLDRSLAARIEFTDDQGGYTWSLADKDTGFVVGSGNGNWSAGQPIALNHFELSLAGVPAQGDTVDIGPTLFPAGNNGNALAMAALRDERFVGDYVASTGQRVDGATMTDAYAATLADVGVRVQSAQAGVKVSAAAATQVQEQLSSKTGVNLDEEAARLIQFQQAYQAAAKVLQVAQSVFDTMLELAR